MPTPSLSSKEYRNTEKPAYFPLNWSPLHGTHLILPVPPPYCTPYPWPSHVCLV